VGAVLAPAVRVVPEAQEGDDVVVGHQPDVTALAPVAPIGAALGDVGLPPEAD
jgi:hypothetical protein